ncbi:MAG: hypothetical protein V7720_03340 [Halioglobus sp.]
MAKTHVGVELPPRARGSSYGKSRWLFDVTLEKAGIPFPEAAMF